MTGQPPSAAPPPSQRYYKQFPDHQTVFPGAFEDLLGYCSARAATHLVEALADSPDIAIRVLPDTAVVAEWRGTFLNIGSSASNIKTDAMKRLPENTFLADDVGVHLTLHDGKHIAPEDGLDRGYILRLPNPFAPGYNLIACAGLGEWGTSGAAWFFAQNWRSLRRRFGTNPFLIVVAVHRGGDQSAREILAIGKQRWLWRAARRLLSPLRRR